MQVEPLTREAFAPFGDVIQTEGATHFPINQGTTERYHDLARIDVGSGDPLVSIFRSQPRQLPLRMTMLERHPLGSQAFIPLSAVRYLVVVARDDLIARAFLAAPHQGVNYSKGIWHHPLLALDRVSDFLVIDRGGKENNCEEVHVEYEILSLP